MYSFFLILQILHILQVMKTSIGLKRTWEILKTKIEQRCKSSSSGTFAMTSPHVLAKMFHEFDADGGGSLCREEFEKALREKLGMMMISKQDLDLLTDEFDQDGDGEITYEEFISKVMPPEITHGGGGIMDFPCDDPAGQGSSVEQLNKLRKQVKNKMEQNSKNMRVAFRKMGSDGKVDKYEFLTCLRNLGIGVGQPQLVEHLFKEIDDDKSGHLTFAEFTAGIEHPKDSTHDIKIERHIPLNYLRNPTPTSGGALSAANAANPQDQDPRSEDIRSCSSSHASSVASSIKQQVGPSKELKQRVSRWHHKRNRGAPVPVIFATQPVKKTSVAQQRAADLRRSQGRHPINMRLAARAASMRPTSAYIAARPGGIGGSRLKSQAGNNRSRKRPSSGRRLRIASSNAPATRAATIQAAAARASVRWKDSLHKSHQFFRSAPVHNRRVGAAKVRARVQSQLQERVNYTAGKGLVSTGHKKLDLTKLLGIKN